MKSEFALAFNQICAEYNLPREVVLDAVRAALATAYRRDWKVPNNQNVSADINLDTGLAKIYVEQTVVDEVKDAQVEIALREAQRLDKRVEVGDPVMVEKTPRNFGRIAAQTAKQVITQRLREAERESQFTRFSRQEGEIIIGTVQSVTSHSITLHLERTEEAHMPKREQIPSERYMLHQKIRVYVVEVRRTPRGPEITVSRSHPNMLRRMLELEVPEIRSGQVEIKAITREAGTRAKVAVTSRQLGLDPVGACVGMRGIRIQTISRELHGERIDVVEWDNESSRFIANALSIQSVMAVLLDEHRHGGRTASVVVPDNQLSLAIGRAGQNARLAAKLTNWRIDIQGTTEAALWALEQVNENPNLLDLLRDAAPLVPRLASIMRSHDQERYPYTDEENDVIKKVVVAIHRAILAQEEAARQEKQRAKAKQAPAPDAKTRRRTREEDAKATVPIQAYEHALDELPLSQKVRGHLEHNKIHNVGEVMERVALGDEALLILTGIGSKSLKEIKSVVEESDFQFVDPTQAQEEAVTESPKPEEAEADVDAKEATEATEAETQAPKQAVELEAEGEETAEVVEEETLEEKAVLDELEQPDEALEAKPEAVSEEEGEETISELEEEEEEEESPFSIDSFDTLLEPDYDLDDIVEEPDEDEEDILDKRRGRKKRRKSKRHRPLIYDDETGETYVMRKRRQNRPSDTWDEY